MHALGHFVTSTCFLCCFFFSSFFFFPFFERLRSIHTKKTGKKDNSWAGENNHAFVLVSVQNKSKRKEGDSEEEEDEDDDSEDQRDDEEEEEEEAGGKRGKKTDICEEEVSGNIMLLT